MDSTEVVALELRYAQAKRAASDEGYGVSFESYESAVSNSDAVICMPPTRLMPIVLEGGLLSTFMHQIEGEMRVPLDNDFDAIRTSFEEAYFPGYSQEIRFGALSLDGTGHASYGVCAIILKNSAIGSRSSVFEFPLYNFSRGLNLANPIPAGHRAVWGSRAKLAAVKVGVALQGVNESEFQGIILPPPTGTESDCIEVHIYGPLNLHSIKSVAFYDSTRPADRAIQDIIQAELDGKNVPVRKIS